MRSRPFVVALSCVALAACAEPRHSSATAPPPSAASAEEPASVTSAEPATSAAPEAPIESAAAAPGASADPPLDEVPTCVALPLRRPADLSIRFLRHVLPHGQSVHREGLELHAEIDCPVLTGHRRSLDVIPCRRVSSAELDRVYGELVRSGFVRMRSDGPRQSSPHYGLRALSVHWQSHACEVLDSVETPIGEKSKSAFFHLIDLVTGAGVP